MGNIITKCPLALWPYEESDIMKRSKYAIFQFIFYNHDAADWELDGKN